MKISLNWLKEQNFFACPQNIRHEDLSMFMPLRGFEVEGVEAVGDDHVIEFSVTPNRADCMSMRGLAREIACLYQLPFQDKSIAIVVSQIKHDKELIKIQASKACPHYAGCFVYGIPRGVQAPAVFLDRLQKAGIESIHPIVDICNYVMLELGQPLHAFDASKIQNIEVRFAKVKESVEVLGGQTLTLAKNTLVIADETGVQAVAGVIGGLASGVSEHTTDIFLESAYFTPEAIAGRARQYGLATEAAQRFERGVDPELTMRALEYAVQLICQHLGGERGRLIFLEAKKTPSPKPIKLRKVRLQRLLFAADQKNLSDENRQALKEMLVQASTILHNLGMQVDEQKNTLKVTPPSFRVDFVAEKNDPIASEAALIEEIARVYGYDKIYTQRLALPEIAKKSEDSILLDTFRDVLVQHGYHESISYSFISEALQQQCFPDQKKLHLKNPISSELSVMRTSIWPSLLLTLQYNLNRQQIRAKFFEVGRVYHPLEKNLPDQPLMLSGLITGSRYPEQWGEKAAALDFFDMKGDVETLLARLIARHAVKFKAASHPMLHPGQTAEVHLYDCSIGFIGRLHPALQQHFHFPEAVYLFELDLHKIFENKKAQDPHLARTIALGDSLSFEPISKFPSIRRDFAFFVKRDQPVEAILDEVKHTLGEICRSVILFDVYQGKNMAEDQKSIAFGVVLQAVDSTLSDEQVNEKCARLVRTLTQNFGMQLR